MKKGSKSIPFFVRVIKNISEFIAGGDSISILYTLYSILYSLFSILSFRTLYEQTNEIKHRLRRFLHILHRNPFLFAVERVFACKDIRAG